MNTTDRNNMAFAPEEQPIPDPPTNFGSKTIELWYRHYNPSCDLHKLADFCHCESMREDYMRCYFESKELGITKDASKFLKRAHDFAAEADRLYKAMHSAPILASSITGRRLDPNAYATIETNGIYFQNPTE